MTDEELIAINQAAVTRLQQNITGEQAGQQDLNTTITQTQNLIVESNARIDDYEILIQWHTEIMTKAGLPAQQ